MRFTVGMPWSISKTQSAWVGGIFVLEVPHHKRPPSDSEKQNRPHFWFFVSSETVLCHRGCSYEISFEVQSWIKKRPALTTMIASSRQADCLVKKDSDLVVDLSTLFDELH